MNPRTLPRLFEESVVKFPNNIFLWEKRKDKYEGTTLKELQAMVQQFTGGLLALDVNHGDRIAIISEGRNDWVMAELGILFTGAVNVPISVKIEELSELKFRLAHSESRIAIVSKNQFPKVQKIKNDLPDLEKIIVLDPMDSYDEDEMSTSDVMMLGKEYLQMNQKDFEKRWQSIQENDYATISYTSGTTADPKGVILTHRNYTANVEQAMSLIPIPERYVLLLILPWDHCFGHVVGIYTLMKNGASLASIQIGNSPIETLRNIPVNIKETRPTFLLSVPALAKNFKRNIEKGIREKGPKVEKLFNAALRTAYEYNKEGWNKGKGIQKLKMPLLKIYDKLIFSKIRENFGGRLEFFIGGGALLDIELQRFFYAIGIPMFQGYGLSEATPVISANTPAKHKLGSSGILVSNLEIKICDDNGNSLPTGQKGEIVVKGENVMAGYWKNEKSSAEVVKDGWLFTGDMGYLDEDGFLYVLGRFKSLLISSDGEKYSPEGIEEAITEHTQYIDQIMLYNNQNPYTVALVVPNKEAIKRWLTENNQSEHTEEGQTAVLRLIESGIAKFKDDGELTGMFPSRWLPAAIAVLGEGFTEQNKFLNSTMKMVRSKIIEYYKNRIDFLFTPEGKDINNHQNLIIISRIE